MVSVRGKNEITFFSRAFLMNFQVCAEAHVLMPIAGIVISTHPKDVATACQQLAGFAGVEIHGSDERGNIVAVFDTRTPEEMEALLQRVNACPVVLHAGVTYLNMEDLREEGVDVNSRQCPGCQQGKE